MHVVLVSDRSAEYGSQFPRVPGRRSLGSVRPSPLVRRQDTEEESNGVNTGVFGNLGVKGMNIVHKLLSHRHYSVRPSQSTPRHNDRRFVTDPVTSHSSPHPSPVTGRQGSS